MSFLQAFLLALVEGITEFLPISSTGHMIICSSLMGIAEEKFTKLFTVAIQFGAILSVVVLYFKRFFQTVNFYLKLFVAFIPAAIAGIFLGDVIDMLLENVIVVAAALLLGGVLLLFIDRWFKSAETSEKTEISFAEAFKIGCFQVIAMIPGVSRSAATIVGGLAQNLTREKAAEFSFFLAVPTMFAATCKSLYKFYEDGFTLTPTEINLLLFGNVIAFIVAMLAIKTFIRFLTTHGLKIYGYYRIIVGAAILILYFSGVKLSMI